MLVRIFPQILAIAVAILLVVTDTVKAADSCIKCSGIGCQRSTKTKEACASMDACVTIFRSGVLEAQGCMQNIADELRASCSQTDDSENEPSSDSMSQVTCNVCFADDCNGEAPEELSCVQCDSNTDEKCRSDPASLKASRCPMPTAIQGYCSTVDDGKRTIRACSSTPIEQDDCSKNADCTLCSPTELKNCNKGIDDTSGPDDGDGADGGSDGGSGSGSGSGDGGSGSGSGSGSGDGSGSGSGSGGGSGSGSGSGDGSGSGSGGGSGSGSGGGSGSGSGGGSGSGSGSGGGGSGSGSGSGDGGSGSGSGGGSGSGSGGGSGSGSGDGGSGSGSGDGGSGSGDGGSGGGGGSSGISTISFTILALTLTLFYIV